MRRELIGAALALALGAAQAGPCTLVFGQARNPTEADAPDWNGLNTRFNTAVASALDTGGRRVVAMTVPNERVDARSAGLALLQRADEEGCSTLVETTVFADPQQQLILRLRVYPLLPQLGADASIIGLRIGSVLFVTQRELAMSTLTRLKPELMAAQMAGEYLQHDRR